MKTIKTNLGLKIFAVSLLLLSISLFSSNKNLAAKKSFAATPILHQETVSGISTSSLSVTSADAGIGLNQLYIAAVSTTQYKPAQSVTGLNLTWTKVIDQCGGRNQTGVSLWYAFGSASAAGPVTATFTQAPGSAAITVSRYSGVNSIFPVEGIAGANTLGQNGACSGGVDNSSVNLQLSASQPDSVLITATASRAKTVSVADPDYQLITSLVAGSSGSTTTLTDFMRTLTLPGTDQVTQTLSGTSDWSIAGLTINPDSGTPTITPTDTLTPTPTTTISPTPTPTDTPTPTPTPPPGNDPVLVGAGDISTCSNSNDEATASLLDNIPGTVFTAGDNVYESGTLTEFNNCYGPTWGRHKARTYPATGNHEYLTSGASGYFDYFGAAAGPRGKGYYSYNLGSWHIVVLNSNCSSVGGCSTGSAQEKWLRADLAANPTACTLAYWHHPVFSSSGSSSATRPLWQALQDYHAEAIVNGHRHNYERFAPQTATGVYDPINGIREFVAGMGGDSHGGFKPAIANSEVRNSDTYGVLKFTLHDASFDWQFVPVAGKTFTDSGSQACH